MVDGWWTIELCVGKKVSQVHYERVVEESKDGEAGSDKGKAKPGTSNTPACSPLTNNQ